ncbi:GNAT family N-acetyltransferase [Ectothiorhodospira haloalkaliphila]|uniref:GNAT family N-acyltransferase n=1 Tax=Ectothiorhodospira haloalkaliphila TaxID=421628 RepID=UPI001EE8B303|nr:GNAT family N-acyltransferase [Ectothiorhodospira haloalkaliphila]MCG5524437.1 GNAT family N-acetyltransferase [Ectothiorhodospira haloalkaliphila]
MFDARYEVIVADTVGTRRVHHEIRYAVYCLERGFEDPGKFPDGQEEDAWDAHSTAFIVRERETGQWLGSMRLVHPSHGQLPIHRLTRMNGADQAVNPASATEMSRICITGDYLRYRLPERAVGESAPVNRHGFEVDGRTTIGSWRTQQRGPLFRATPADDGECLNRQGMNAAVSPEISVAEKLASLGLSDRSELFAGMLRAAIEYSRDKDIPYMYFLVNRALARMVRRLGFEFSLAGMPCEHRGVRYPYLAHLDTAVQCAVASSHDMARLFQHGGQAYQLASRLGILAEDGNKWGQHHLSAKEDTTILQ